MICPLLQVTQGSRQLMKELTHWFNDGRDRCCNHRYGKNVQNHVGRHGGAVDTSSRTRRTADRHISRDQSALPVTQTATVCGNVCRNQRYEKYRSFRFLFHHDRHIPITETRTPRSQPEQRPWGFWGRELRSITNRTSSQSSSAYQIVKTQRRWRQASCFFTNPRLLLALLYSSFSSRCDQLTLFLRQKGNVSGSNRP